MSSDHDLADKIRVLSFAAQLLCQHGLGEYTALCWHELDECTALCRSCIGAQSRHARLYAGVTYNEARLHTTWAITMHSCVGRASEKCTALGGGWLL